VDVRSNPIVDRAEWQRQRAHAAEDPGGFHGEIAKREVHWYDPERAAWITFDDASGCWTGWSHASGEAVVTADRDAGFVPWQRAFDGDDPPFFGWFAGGLTNAAFNEVDRHVLAGHGEEIAFIVEGDEWDEAAGQPLVSFSVSRARLLLETVKAALVLRALGLRRGDRVALNMPNVIEQVYYSEAAKRLGVIYTPVFGGFSAKTLSERIADAGARVVVTADGGYRNGRVVPYKAAYADPALDEHVERETDHQRRPRTSPRAAYSAPTRRAAMLPPMCPSDEADARRCRRRHGRVLPSIVATTSSSAARRARGGARARAPGHRHRACASRRRAGRRYARASSLRSTGGARRRVDDHADPLALG
jgi:AMP-binding enzyme